MSTEHNFMKRRQIPQIFRFLSSGWRVYATLFITLITATLIVESCRLKANARVTTVYGKVTDQAKQPVDSVTVRIHGSKGFTGGASIGSTRTDSKGEYELVVDVPKEYSGVDMTITLGYETLRSRYKEQLTFEDGVQQNTCCPLSIGKKRNYDFVLLPK